MSLRSKAFTKKVNAKLRKSQQLETADDFQAAGVDFEEAAGKWRAGDPAKSMRFFQRAIDVYDQGLHKYPQSLDLAYNKARVQLEIASHPLLVKQLQHPLRVQLELALHSHRLALSLDHDSSDTLFNTAQVLTSLGEEATKDDQRDTGEAVQFLEEALDLQDRCLRLQESTYEESQQLQNQIPQETSIGSEDSPETGASNEKNASTQDTEDQWFSIIEPVTLDVLTDTVLAQLNTLTSLCGVLCSSPDQGYASILPRVEEYSANISAKIPYFVKDDPSRTSEVALAKANFLSALLEAGFRLGSIDADTYRRERDMAFAQPDLKLEDHGEGLIADAQSLLSLSAALGESEGAINNRWTALVSAVRQLQKAANLPTNPTVPDIVSKSHLLRGDASLQQSAMSRPPVNHPTAVANAAQLLKNAQVFYKNASRLAIAAEDKAIATLRSGIAVYLASQDRTAVTAVSQGQGEAWFTQQMEDMVVEGLIPADLQI